MRFLMNDKLCVTAVTLFLLTGAGALRGGEAKKEDAGEPATAREQLDSLKAAVRAAQKEAVEANREYLRFQDSLVYSNEVVSNVYQEVRQLEKELVEKRKELREEMMKLPEMREMMKKRDKAFEKASELKRRWQMLQKEVNEARQTKSEEDDRS